MRSTSGWASPRRGSTTRSTGCRRGWPPGCWPSATWLVEGRQAAANAWRTRRAQAGNTASPNAGQTMATMAGALGVTLTKRGHYTLAGGDAEITPDVLARGRRIVRVAAGLAVVGATVAA